jgi:hypothetical protein
MEDLTWAEATGLWYVIPWSPRPSILSGAQSFPRMLVMEAPIRDSGEMILRIGLEEIDASPETTEVKGCGASIPEMILVVVPLFPV